MATAGLSNKTSNNRLNGIANGRWNIECLQNRGALGTSILNFLQNPQGWFIIRLETEGFWCVQRLHNRKQIISLKEPFLYPDEEWDRDGVYSGSAYTCEDGIHYFYTGNVKLWDKDYDYIMNGREQNTIHVFSPDGKNIAYKKLVMTNDDYPVNMSKHVRDPKIYKKDGRYYMIQGGRDAESYGCALLFCSDDLEHWKWYDTVRTAKPFGYMWECPDLFGIADQQIMTCCPQ